MSTEVAAHVDDGVTLTCSYDPCDNKMRLRASHRLDRDLYNRVRAAGFIFAPKQDLFVAPMWTPEREDLMLELCGEIGDEDTSLVERAEERADRFEDYSEKRASDAASAHKAVEQISQRFELGQPILCGHHSEKKARKDAERIENGMRQAVKMWDTSNYWTRRAAAAMAHAKYKELPGVRHRRIKTLEADKRRHERTIAEAAKYLKVWRQEDLTLDRAKAIANYDHTTVQEDGKNYRTSMWSMLEDGKMTPEAAALLAIPAHERQMAHASRWVAHLQNRLTYERAMLGDQGGVVVEREGFAIDPGGRVLVRNEWLVVQRVNRKDGKIVSIRPVGSYIRGVEEIKDYRAPEGDDAAKVRARGKLAPIVNYPSEGCREMTKADYDSHAKHSDFWRLAPIKASATAGAHRRREGSVPGGGGWRTQPIFITDMKRVDPPAPTAEAAAPVTFVRIIDAPRGLDVLPKDIADAARRALAVGVPDSSPFDAMRASLKAGVQVVAVDQLFPTPPDLAKRVVERADVAGHRVLEPSAGLGSLAVECVRQGAVFVQCIEIAEKCCAVLRRSLPATCGVGGVDFLALERRQEQFARVCMNPPFADGQDVVHVTHAFTEWLAPGGRLVAIMSAGVKFRQDRATTAFRELVAKHGGTIEELPEDSFKASGTSVRTVLVTIDRT